ncbi:hypothetical protein [Agromyces mariniharenae]|uniref:DUF1918 domain-containing protein n=1 Tax=Agromyces mariniharenae TaxID=2604423 RepID=A0A5S4V8P1_9MICO|nr:hypothetical protein [Agromyces mariniharenae]TYL50485.1 hypothetical protein FYC51_14900 [Agromyces mariniharenae]
MTTIDHPRIDPVRTESAPTELAQTRQLVVGDMLVNAAGSEYEVTKLARLGRGIRVHYLTRDGRQGRFTSAPEAIVRRRDAERAERAS